jgi:dipeptidyl aminopeptidase/acylaminoacyl peptidase
VTSLGLERRSIWLHDAGGERRVTSEVVASAPWLSPDAKRLYFLAAPTSDAPSGLWRLDISQGQQQPVLPGLHVVDYDISSDEHDVVFSVDHEKEPEIWVAPLDHHLPPRLLVRGADSAAFDASGHVFFRLLGAKSNYLYRIRSDGTSKERVLEQPILHFQSVSPTGQWAAVLAVVDGKVATVIQGFGADRFRWVREGYWETRWSADGKALYLEAESASSTAAGKTLPIMLAAGMPPQIPLVPAQSGGPFLEHATEGFAPGPDADTYVFTRTQWLRNIFRIPLHP